ncbi:MAG: PAS domain S-box protein [Candidatus Aegiribacteria sp.]|nr:PAS domain S-box protein [Candidatus Aegiribacteria sp.]
MKLKTEISLLIAVTALLTGGTIALLVSNVMHNTLEQELEKRGVVIAQTLAEHVTQSVIDGEVIAAHSVLNNIVRRTDNVEFACIIGFDGEVFTHSFESGFPRALLPGEHDLIHPDSPRLDRFSIGDEVGLMVGYPLIDGMKAHIHLGLNQTYLHDQIMETRNQIIGITFVVALAIMLLGFILSDRIARPLVKLSKFLKNFGEEQIVQELSYHGGGREVADLTHAFNLMVTERERAEDQIRTLAAIVEQSSEGIILTDMNGILTFVNRACADIHGYDSTEELSGKHLSIFHNEMQMEKEVNSFNRKVIEQGSHRGQVDHMHMDGTVFPTRMTSNIIKDRRGKPVSIAGYMLDITAQKQLEQQLLQSQKMEAIGLLSGGVAHDFNNILQAIIGYADLARSSLSEDDAIYDNIEEIYSSAKKASDLTRQLLAFGRRQVLVPRDIDLNHLIDGMLKMLGRVIGEDIKINFIKKGHRLGTVHADPGQIEQVLVNLCVNSRDAMPQGGYLTIETENVLITEEYTKAHLFASKGRYVLVTLSDNGCGMNEGTRNRIFEPFFTTKDADRGSGLGLATAFGIINQHEGYINVYSEVGIGTTFKIYLPLVERPAEEIGIKVESKVVGGTESILVAEDNDIVRKLARHVLERAGYTVFHAEDGYEALEVLKQYNSDISLALLDVVMPGMSGREVHDVIMKTNPDIKVLFTSGYSQNCIHTRFVLDEGIQLIRKPYDPNTLLREVRDALDK